MQLSLLASLLWAGMLQAQPAASPLSADGAQPVRVVCIADSPDAFKREASLREHLPVALGQRFVVPLGSGFVVDRERRHVVSSWHAVTACNGDGSAGGNGRRQVGVLETAAAEPLALVAERLPDRTFSDAGGSAVSLVQALCRDQREPCAADLPRGPDDKPLAEAARRRQLDNLLAYAPDLAVLRLRSPLSAQPLPLALQQQLDDQMRLSIRSFAPQGLTAATTSVALYTGPQQISHLPIGGQPGDEIHAKLHRLAANVAPGQAGAAVLRGAAVVGVLSALQALPGPASGQAAVTQPITGTAYAVPVTVVAVFLDLLKVPYVTLAAETPAPEAVALSAALAGGPAPTAPRSWWSAPQGLMLGGALLLAVAAAAAFLTLARRNRQAAKAPLLPQRTVTRVNPTLLHAVAMPTEAIEAIPAPPPVPEAVVAPAQTLTAPPVLVQLRCSEGPLDGSMFALPMPNGGTTLFVGRDAQSCQIVFPPYMDRVSAVHACFAWDAPTRRLSVRDLSSSGTWLNGQRIDKGRTLTLTGGDQVELGGPGINRFSIDIPGDPRQHVTELLS